MNKKAQFLNLENVGTIVMTLIFAVFITAAGLIAFVAFREIGIVGNSAFDSNSTFTAVNQTAVNFSTTSQLNCTSVAIVNNTNSDVTSDFSIVGCLATWDAGSSPSQSMTANYTYRYLTYTELYTTTNNAITMGVNFTGQMGTIGTMIGIGLILIIIVGIYYMVGRGKDGGL